ncbi:hypothetical protein CSKR_110600 [Clonorchis sinensis]|uniref:Uncharacterized protein n=1 Tax=Clonorchis sinensis TaxID=79923 RepID=A0A419PKU0_CLOSI|nr:hypothetical protein CSKR_110600 [Clonorchis sinensis]
MCCTRPPHVPVATIFEISRYMYIRNGLLIRLLKILRQPTTSFALLGAHQVGAVPELNPIIILFKKFAAKSLFFRLRQPLILEGGYVLNLSDGNSRYTDATHTKIYLLWSLNLRTIGQESKTLICISFTKLNIHLLLERVFLNFSRYSLTVTQMRANATKRLHKFRNRSHFSRDAKQIYEKTCYSHASSVVSTVTLVVLILSMVYRSGALQRSNQDVTGCNLRGEDC